MRTTPEIFEARLKKVFDKIDDFLESKYGKLFSLQPNRAEMGETSNKETDGLFNVGAAFSPGYGSKLGRGYTVEIRLSTFEHVSRDIQERIRKDVLELLNKGLDAEFPERELDVDEDGNLLKIHGDFSLEK